MVQVFDLILEDLSEKPKCRVVVVLNMDEPQEENNA